MKQKIERKKYPTNFPMTIWDKIDDIQNDIGLSTASEVLQYCVIFTHEKKMNNYVQAIKSRPRATAVDPVERAKAKVEGAEAEKEAKKRIIHDQGMRLCKLLQGEVVETSGLYSCKYDAYEVVNPNYATKGAMTVPFEQLSESHVTNQIRPVGTKREDAIRIYNAME
tara:strand:- start:3127 stop:3627 length:501 start_codon:yes stop_codon:yes gene_type:complete